MRAAIPSAKAARTSSQINPAPAIMESPNIPFEPIMVFSHSSVWPGRADTPLAVPKVSNRGDGLFQLGADDLRRFLERRIFDRLH
jgi:hypothetical protein